MNGTFAQVSVNSPFLTPMVLYDGGTGNDVVLMLEGNAGAFIEAARTPNQLAVAGALAVSDPNSALLQAIFPLTAPQARAAFDALSGEIHATVSACSPTTAAMCARRSSDVSFRRPIRAMPTRSHRSALAVLKSPRSMLKPWRSAMTTNPSRTSRRLRASPSGRAPMAPGAISTATGTPRAPSAISAASSQAWTRVWAARGGSASAPAIRNRMSPSPIVAARPTWRASISRAMPAAWPVRSLCAAAVPGPGTTSTPPAP